MMIEKFLLYFSQRRRQQIPVDKSGKKFAEEEQLRSELFSTRQLWHHGKIVAKAHKISGGRGSNQLLRRLADNEKVLFEIRNKLTQAVSDNRRVTPAEEWFLDNFYLIEEQIRTARRHLPKVYSKELPHLEEGHSAHLPRVYDIALEIISHGDGRVDSKTLSLFVSSYQTISELKIGELWAIPIMLRLALIENIRRIAVRISNDRTHRNLADYWAQRLIATARKDPKNLFIEIAEMAKFNPPMVGAFVAEISRQLHGQGPSLTLPLTWIEQHLAESGQSIKGLVQLESQKQAADQVSMSNSILSLRFLGTMNWREFVETLSPIDRVLREDPADTYFKMDFFTRDQYRHAVETIARKSRISESEVARLAVDLARQEATGNDKDRRRAHVGYYLIDAGRNQLERLAQVKLTPWEIAGRISSKMPFLLYVGAILLLTALLTGGAIFLTRSHEINTLMLAMLALISAIGFSQLAVALVNWAATILIKPRPLPRMDFSQGIPPECRTLVAVPTILLNENYVATLLESLEVRFLANRHDNLFFALLTDFRDAKTQTLPDDDKLLALAKQGIERLNEKYAEGREDIFFLFHRSRLWNPSENVWMGYERKRGKLGSLNAFLRGKAKDPFGNLFSTIAGDVSALRNIRYVITLDSDTKLPRETAWQMIGTMAHPLNRPVFDETRKIVREGYGILQPRVSVLLPNTNRSIFAAIHGSSFGIDPYTKAVSDVYQDIFGEGSFIGKGIYDIDAFEASLDGYLPENHILSHDLIEGCYARSGLISDVQLYEEYPADYRADVRRRHRWIRGDWQIARWVMSRVPTFNGKTQKNPLTYLSQWKIFDNLRRSLVPASLTLMLLLSWILLPSGLTWTLFVLAVFFVPPLLTALLNLIQKQRHVLFSHHVSFVAQETRNALSQSMCTLVCLPYEAYFSMDAVLRTIWRMAISRKHLLEWNPSENVNRHLRSDFAGYARDMWFSLFWALFSLAVLLFFKPFQLTIAAPFLIIWSCSPLVAWSMSKPLLRREIKLSADQVDFLKKSARRIWAFFETFVTEDENWLPPDNYQEHPVGIVAHRTSPTNIGLSLLSNLCARDFGYLTNRQFIERTARTLSTLTKMERYRGHFYNWYDTQSLDPLHPLYVSSVDSGNLTASLLILKTGLYALGDQKILDERIFDGLQDTLRLMEEKSGKLPSAEQAKIKKYLNEIVASRPSKLADLYFCLDILKSAAEEMLIGVKSHLPADEDEMLFWTERFLRQINAAQDDLRFFAPWICDPRFFQIISEIPVLNAVPTFRELTGLEGRADSQITMKKEKDVVTVELSLIYELKQMISESQRRAAQTIDQAQTLAGQCVDFSNIEYDFLYDKSCNLLAIGYNVSNWRRDNSYYDLLAGEARLSCFVGIAQGKLPQESWFSMGRLLTSAVKKPVLVSWSGSMFEYLMPLLIMPKYEDSLLDETYQGAVGAHIAYGRKRSIPWGISESGYNAFDSHMNYQYRAFGVPGLGLKRGLADDLVVAPYATFLALMIDPESSCRNLRRLSEEGALAQFGFYEAIDYTPSRLSRGQKKAIIASYMAHHQGMSFLALAYALLDQPMQKLFEKDPLFQSSLLLLQERVPKAVAFYTSPSDIISPPRETTSEEMQVRIFNSPDTTIPEVQLLSNGRYHVMLTNAGGGYSRWGDLAITRFRADTTRDDYGIFCYVSDVETGAFWSTAYQPTRKQPQHYEAIFSEGRVEYRRRDDNVDMHTQIVVSPEDDVEIRRTVMTNLSRKTRILDVTSYAEVVMAPAAADRLHPAFSNLFVQTEIDSARRTVLCTRRPRSEGEKNPWMLHAMAVHGKDAEQVSYETDRLRFIGRTKTLNHPQVMESPSDLFGTLSDSQGSVLDPIAAIRSRITLEPEQSAVIDLIFGIGQTREEAVSLADKYQDRRIVDRVFSMAWTQSHVLLRQINASESDVQLYNQIASSLIYPNDSMRAEPGVMMENRRGQSGLWGYSVSGDLPIVLLKISDQSQIELARQLVQAYVYWRLKGLNVDLFIWNEEHAGYRQLLHDQIMSIVSSGFVTDLKDQPGGIFVRAIEQIAEEDRILIQTVAHVIIAGNRGKLINQIRHRTGLKVMVPRLIPSRTNRPQPKPTEEPARKDLLFFNGSGGFTPDGREYVILLSPNQATPAPWANILANPEFGTVISESGMAYTWAENAHEFRLTPWHNDPVADRAGEAFYIRDEERGPFWSPMPLPRRGAGAYVIRHGFGYSVFEHSERFIHSEVRVYTALDAPVKFIVLKIKNNTPRTRRLSVTGFIEWVLGDFREKTAMHIITELDHQTGAIFARNPYNTEFPHRIAFFNTSAITRTFTGNRAEFLGRNGTLADPAVMKRQHLSGKVGAGMDPCAAIQVPFDLLSGEEKEIVFTLGAAKNINEARRLVQFFTDPGIAAEALQMVRNHWTDIVDTVRIQTPDPSLNIIGNGWLIYQTIACRLWAKTGYYQSGGAFGFRDQLQDVTALTHIRPELTRKQLLLCASRQFEEGDVQHWWHPPMGRGVRTRCSDDYLWLPFAAGHYIAQTGDESILDEKIPFISGRPVTMEEDSYYDMPLPSPKSASFYEHCVLAIRYGLRYGEHGLPLMGSGDWNDGMNMVGIRGKGESVWLGFFLYSILTNFARLAEKRNDTEFSRHCAEEAEKLRRNIEQYGWDGQWYRRAFFDDGSPLGSAKNPECRIDSISQSWAVLSGAGDDQRARKAMNAVSRYLVNTDTGIVRLLWPPFDQSELNPGYIKGYVPGVRENGGQYTHSAVWAAMAFARLGDSARAWEIMSMINPINHALTPQAVDIYKVEPYVVAADIYALPPHTGRGGWTWYTGSAGWMYRLILEYLLGLRREENRLSVKPCLPDDWDGFSIRYRFGKTLYDISVTRAAGKTEEPVIFLDGMKLDENEIPLADDAGIHQVRVII
ncbi:MAG TPA: glucoamylase family protein [Smithella sp.]|nr:glucoamylase family protein [Smithella sp.]